MIKISTKFNGTDRRDLKKQQRLILISGALCASFGVVGGIVLAAVIKPVFLILLIGSAVIFFTALFFCRYLASAAKKNADVYLVLTFDENAVKIESVNPSVLTAAAAAAATYPLSACSVSLSENGNYRLTTPDSKSFAFNADGFTVGSKEEPAEPLKKTDRRRLKTRRSISAKPLKKTDLSTNKSVLRIVRSLPALCKRRSDNAFFMPNLSQPPLIIPV
jgi:hypothetical protein